MFNCSGLQSIYLGKRETNENESENISLRSYIAPRDWKEDKLERSLASLKIATDQQGRKIEVYRHLPWCQNWEEDLKSLNDKIHHEQVTSEVMDLRW